jgi:hypothetical protein
VPFLERVFLAAGGDAGSWFNIMATANAGYDTNDDGILTPETEGQPIDLNAQLGPLAVSVVDARALLDLRAGANVIDQDITGAGDGRLTFQEIVSNATAGTWTRMLEGRYRDPSNIPIWFDGTAQALIPIDASGPAGNDPPDAVSTIPDDLKSPSKDARIEIAGRLMNPSSPTAISSRSGSNVDPVHHTGAALTAGNKDSTSADIADPLRGDEFNQTKFLVHTHNVSGLLSGLTLNFDTIAAGLDSLLTGLENALKNGVFDKLPLVRKRQKRRDAVSARRASSIIRNGRAGQAAFSRRFHAPSAGAGGGILGDALGTADTVADVRFLWTN